MKKIIIDILGGDNAPHAILDGVVMAAKKDKQLQFLLIGDETQIKERATKEGFVDRVEIIHTTESISNNEPPTNVRVKTNSSIALAVENLRKREDCGAFVSAGSTGAVLAGSVLRVGRIPGVSRPALCPLFPTKTPGKNVIVVDVGANVDCRPEHLFHFAIMGSEYMKSMGIPNPRVALVNVGVEDKKGNELTAGAFQLLKQSDLNFVGNMEARDAFSGDYDVLVCDGFVGNVLLKTAEGAMKLVGARLKGALKSGPISILGALLVKGKLKKMSAELGEEAAGGAIFIGAKKTVVKAHGSSEAHAFANAIHLANRAMQSDMTENIEKAIARNTITEEEKKDGE
ncbi:MAG: phosphate acyltransferase PlsX [Firmicutes bacterium]|nr:phosphate acyltransferase PlsX [Bacillota bacterium]